MSYGPDPWQQLHWDARAAVNFVAGGAGAGLVVASGLAGGTGGVPVLPLLAGLALIALGLLSVWFEIGRPLRALNVFLNPNTSWMTREAFVAAVLLPTGVAAAAGVRGTAAVAVVLAIAFVLCQASILRAARGIPAWRDAMTLPLIATTGLAEGAGLFTVWSAWADPSRATGVAVAMLVLVALRFVLGATWYRRLAPKLRARPLAALNGAGHAFNGGSLAALAVGVVALASPLPAGWREPALALAGLLAAAGGMAFKWMLVTRASYNQGFALPHLPVRGSRD